MFLEVYARAWTVLLQWDRDTDSGELYFSTYLYSAALCASLLVFSICLLTFPWPLAGLSLGPTLLLKGNRILQNGPLKSASWFTDVRERHKVCACIYSPTQHYSPLPCRSMGKNLHSDLFYCEWGEEKVSAFKHAKDVVFFFFCVCGTCWFCCKVWDFATCGLAAGCNSAKIFNIQVQLCVVTLNISRWEALAQLSNSF